MDPSLLWIPATLIASAGQTARNTMQRHLTERIGTLGATQVRFLFGFPFACLFLLLVLGATGEKLPRPDGNFWSFLPMGALSQIAATALMLAAMRQRSFSVITALLKTEALQIALFGLVVLGDRISPLGSCAILVATAGVMMMSWTSRTATEAAQGGVSPVLFGLAAGGLFALSAVGFRGAILALDSGTFLLRASTALVWSLGAQTALLGAWLALFARPALIGSLRHWRSSLGAGLLGAAASQLWFIGFALTPAANVRTLALVEVFMAQFVARRVFAQVPSSREVAGMGMVVGGILVLLLASG